MKKKLPQSNLENLPGSVVEFIKLVIKKMRYRKKVRSDVQAELSAHFEDELKDCRTDQEKERKAKQLIEGFGDVKLLGVLLRRAKKRCRPLWRTIAVRTFQTTSVLILCLIVYVVWFFSGKPAITANYVAELNRIVRPVTDDNLNAAPLYEKAITLFDDPNDYYWNLFSKDYNEVQPEEKQQIEQWISDNKAIFDLLIAGTNKPYYWQQYEGDNMISILMPNLADFRKFAYALRRRAQLHAEKERYQDAFDDIKSSYLLGQHLKGDKTLIEQLVGISNESLAVETLRDVLSRYSIDSGTLAKLQKDFEQIISDEDFVVSLKIERLFMYDNIQRLFTEDHLGSGHLYLKAFKPLVDFTLGSGLFSQKKAWTSSLLHVLFTHPNKQETKEAADRVFAFWETISCKTPAQIRAENLDIEKEHMKLVKGNMLLTILTPDIHKILEISYQRRVDIEATLTIIGTLRYKNDKGDYPESLEELLTSDYVKTLPIEPFSDNPLIYKKTDDGFILYSVGRNFINDGGKTGKDRKGKPRLWADDGDAVFWPVQK